MVEIAIRGIRNRFGIELKLLAFVPLDAKWRTKVLGPRLRVIDRLYCESTNKHDVRGALTWTYSQDHPEDEKVVHKHLMVHAGEQGKI